MRWFCKRHSKRLCCHRLFACDYDMKFLFSLARTSWGGRLIGWFFAHLSFLLPVKRLYETKYLMAFHHPSPSYPVHILVVPKKAIANLAEIQDADHPVLLEMLRITGLLADQQNLKETGYRLVLNGGAYQDVPHLHFHLISGEAELN